MKADFWSLAFLIHVFVLVRGQGSPNEEQQQAGHAGQHGQQQVHQMNQQDRPNARKFDNRNREHIMEHLDGIIDKPESEMTAEELQQHYFKLHDYDNNNKLDGTELTKAVTHYHGEDQKTVMGEEEIMSLLDPILEAEDLNKDGYISYPEYAKSHRKP